jgi:transcriptional/translational regulatory protein YebC/TACO1
MFERKGLLAVDANSVDEDRLMELGLDAGADDIKRTGNLFEITCDPSLFSRMQEVLAQNKIPTTTAEITQLPKTPMEIDAETAKKVLKLMEHLDEHDDVQNVYSNLNITEEVATAAARE